VICRNHDTKVIARLTKSAPFCHCEERSDEAISAGDRRLPHTFQVLTMTPPLCHCEERSDEAIPADGCRRLPRFARNDR